MLLLFPACTLTAATLTTSITTTKFTVGDKIRFTASLIVPKGSTVTPPATESDFGQIAVKEWNLHKTERQTTDSLLYDYLITTYTPEPCTIPALPFYIGENGTTDTLHTDPVALTITSVLQGDTVDLMGFRNPLSAGNAPKWWLWLLIIVGGIAAITAATLFLVKHFRKPSPPLPPVPPYEEAIDALNELGVKKYLQRGLVREYVFELSDIFKRYIGRRFECNAMDFTTAEMIAWSGAERLSKKLRGIIDWFFSTTDPIKFARVVPDTTTVERFDHDVRDFLEETRPVTQQEAPAESVGTEETSSPKENG